MVATGPEISVPPLDNAEFAALMRQCGPFEASPHIAVAVSGGADSMALLLLCQRWALNAGGKVTALTVDHGLRAESAHEAKQVQDWCLARRIDHHTLSWHPSHLHTSLQATAREARYRLLDGYCKEHNILHIVTAHHRNDQVETLFFRLARNSGLDGLASMSPASSLPSVRLLRPLLSISKERLAAVLVQSHQPWLDDPTNQDTRYTRNHLRKQLHQAKHYPAIAQRTMTVIDSFARIRCDMEHRSASALAATCSIFPAGYAVLETVPWQALPLELRLRILASLAATMAGENQAPRLRQLERLQNLLFEQISLSDQVALNDDSPAPHKHTAFGLLFIYHPRKKRTLICREPKAVEPARHITLNETLLWDKRFRVTCYSTDADRHFYVRALDSDGMKKLQPYPGSKFPTAAMRMLPSLWHLEKPVAVPHIGYTSPDYAHIRCEAVFHPAKALAAQAFFGMNKRNFATHSGE